MRANDCVLINFSPKRWSTAIDTLWVIGLDLLSGQQSTQVDVHTL